MPQEKPWTFMVYLAGDNSLTEEMVWSLQEIKKTSAKKDVQDNVNVVAHFDPRGSKGRRYNFTQTKPGSLIPQLTELRAQDRLPQMLETDGRLEECDAVVYTDAFVNAALARQLAHEIAAGDEGLAKKLSAFLIGSARELEEAVRQGTETAAGHLARAFSAEHGGIDEEALKSGLQERLTQTGIRLSLTGDASKALSAFVADQLECLPHAKRYLVVLSGHGSGATGDFLTDLDPETSLSIPELARIIEVAKERYKPITKREPPDPLIAVLGMDSCLMSTAEVCFEIRQNVGFLVGSEGWVQNTGWPYHRVLEGVLESLTAPTPVRGEDDAGAKQVATRVAEKYSEFYRDYEISGVSTDIAVCNLSRLRDNGGTPAPLVAALQRFCDEGIPRLEGLSAWETSLHRRGGGETEERTVCQQLAQDLCESPRESALTRTRDAALFEIDRHLDTTAEPLHPGEAALLAIELKPDTKFSVSQSKALWRLLNTIEDNCHVCDTNLKERLSNLLPELKTAVQAPDTLAKALAAATAIREFDDGILKALDHIEALEAQGRPEAKWARRSLKKLHQIRWILDLARLVSAVQNAKGAAALDDCYQKDSGLRSALIASRFEAQSFKGGVYVDLPDFCQRLIINFATGDPIREMSRDLADALDEAVECSLSTGADFQHARGLSVYFPVDASDYASEYEDLEFPTVTGWGRLVRAYLRATRRARREEATHWAKPDQHVLRLNDLEVDPLATDTIEARIAGLVEEEDWVPPEEVVSGDRKHGTANKIKHGTAKKIKFGTAKKIKFGTAKKIKFGTAKKIKFGTANKIKGEGAPAIFGNPPDGFYGWRPRPRDKRA